MGDGHAWALAGSAALLIDVGSYGIKEWLAILGSVVGIGGSIFGIWRAWRYSKSQIVQRLLDYLRDEEAKIKEARNRIIRHLRRGEPLGVEPDHEFYHDVKTALVELSNGAAKEAEKRLDRFRGTCRLVMSNSDKKYLSNANLQLATLHLVRGKSANERSETTAARTAWETALQCYSQDAEAARYLGELALAEGNLERAIDHFG